MTIISNGNVGFGTASPTIKVEIAGYSGSVSGNLYAYHHANDIWRHNNGGNWNSSEQLGLRVHAGIVGQALYVVSDERIKKDIVDLIDDEALVKFRQLKPKTYSYRDTNQFGDQSVYGFIAQEVAAIIPNSCTIITDYVPTIMTAAKISLIDASSCVLTMSTEHQLAVNDIIMCKDATDTKIDDISVIEIIDSKTIKINKVFTEEETMFKDETGYSETDVIFVYGKKVDDFHSLKKDSIWTVSTAALQEVDRQQVADKARIATLETQLADVLARLSALESA